LKRRPEPTVGLAIRRVHNTFRQAMETDLRHLDLSLPLAGILLSLDQEDGLSGAELARRETVTAQTMNQLVARLVDRGLVERRPHPDHGRIITLHVTDAGRRLLDDGLVHAVAVEEQMLRGFSYAERRRFLRDLLRCAEALGQYS
jgi:DNA-binding MarR family transcriptional regulator